MEDKKIEERREIDDLEREFIENMDKRDRENIQDIENNSCYIAIEKCLTDYISKDIESVRDSKQDIETSANFHMREIASKLMDILGVTRDLYLDYDFKDIYDKTHMMKSEDNDNLTESLSGMITNKNLKNINMEHVKIFWSGWNEGSQRVGGIISKILHDDGKKIGRIIEATRYSESLLSKCGKWSMEGYLLFKVIIKLLESNADFKKFYDELDMSMIDAALIEELKDFEKEKVEKEKMENLISGGGLLSRLTSLRTKAKKSDMERDIVKIENLRRLSLRRPSLRRPSLASQRVASQKYNSDKKFPLSGKGNEENEEDDEDDEEEDEENEEGRVLIDTIRASKVAQSDTFKRKLKNFSTKLKTIINLIRKELWDNISLEFAKHESKEQDTYSLIVLPLELYNMKNFLNKTLMKVELSNMTSSKIGVIFFEYITKNPKMSSRIDFYQLNIEENTLEKINTVVSEETAIKFVDFNDSLKRKLLSVLKNYYTEKKFTTKTLRSMMEKAIKHDQSKIDKGKLSNWEEIRRDFRRQSKKTRAVAGIIEDKHLRKQTRKNKRKDKKIDKKINKKYRERISISETIKKGVKKVKRVTRHINKKVSRLTRRKKRKN